MSSSDRVADLRHALANVLGPLLTEVQLTLTSGAPFDDETRQSLQEMEKLALRMREILKSSRDGNLVTGSSSSPGPS